jgi:AcrR family transcriptional regulator
MRRRLAPDERREEILRAAVRAFRSRPYDEVQIDAIAREAGASRALINHYFGDKRGLFVAVARHVAARMPEMVRTDLGLGVEEMVAANTDAWLDLIEGNRQTSLLFLGAGPLGLDPELAALQDEIRDGVARRILANHLGEEEIPPAAHLAMRAGLGMMEVALRDWATGRGATREQARTIIIQGILAVVRHVLPPVLAVRDEGRGAGP